MELNSSCAPETVAKKKCGKRGGFKKTIGGRNIGHDTGDPINNIMA